MTWQELEDFERGFFPARYDVYQIFGMTGVRARALHYYVQRRLIPLAVGAGTAARYTYEHVVRLRVLRILKKRGMALREIGILLDGFTMRDLHSLAEGRDPRAAILDVRGGLYREPGARPDGSEPFFRVVVTDGVELLVGPEYHARAAARCSEMTEAIRNILDIA